MLSIGAQLCDGVHDAHRLGTVHRDIKPENVFLGSRNHVNVLDFGVAHHLAEEAEATGKKRWHGTPAYMPREQLRLRDHLFPLATLRENEAYRPPNLRWLRCQ
jgi:serine/threonine-protein kinase